jgi:hypothetical protein
LSKILLAQAVGVWAWAKYSDDIINKVLGAIASGGIGQLTKGAKASWERVEWKLASRKYREKIQELHGTTRVLGKPDPVPLEGIFTDVFILDTPTAYRRYDIEKLRQEPAQIKPSSSERLNGLKLVKNSSSGRLFILGKPGAGKTTFLKYIALQSTTGKLEKVPIFVGLKEWADSGLDLIPFLVKQFDICGFPDAWPFVEYVLEKGDAIVLFDGLDEVKQEEERRNNTIAEIRDFTNKYQRSQCLITCRIAATDYTFEHFAYVEIADFNDEQIFAFARKWFKDDEAKYESFTEGIKKPENSGLYELASVPILLTLLCLSFNTTMEFPQRRVEVYEEALDALLKMWDATRSIRRDEIYHGLTHNRKRQMLARIAAVTFQENKYFVPQAELSAHIVKFLRQLPGHEVGADVDGDDVLKSIEAHHGILSERAKRIYSFSHLTFQEYFAAKEVVDDPSGVGLRGLLSPETVADDRWREVILMTASLLNNASEFFKRFRAATGEMIQNEPNLVEMFEWANRKAWTALESDEVVIERLYYLSLGLIFDIDRSMSRERARVCQVALGRAEQFVAVLRSEVDLFQNHLTAFPLGLNQKRTDNKALELDRAYDLTREFEVTSHVTPNSRRSVDLELSRLQFLTDLLTHSVAEGPRRAFAAKFAAYYHRTLERCQVDFGEEVEQTLNQVASSDGSLVRQHIWVKFADQLRSELVRQRDIGQQWRLSKHHVEILSQVLRASNLMYDCLQVAAVDERPSIAQGLLSPSDNLNESG